METKKEILRQIVQFLLHNIENEVLAVKAKKL